MIHSGSDSVFKQEVVRFNLDRVVDETNQLMKILPIEIDIQIRTVYLRSWFCSLSWRQYLVTCNGYCECWKVSQQNLPGLVVDVR